MPPDIMRLRQQNVFGEYDPNQEMMDLYSSPMEEQYNPYQDMGPDMGGYEPMPIQQPVGQNVAAPQTSFMDMWNKIQGAYTPETSARDRQNRLLDNYPGQYNPTTGDRWAAALIGLGERNKPNGDVVGVQNQILQGPRMRDIEDWKNQITPAGVASTNENARNIQERTLLSNAIQADTQAQRIAEQGRIADDKNETTRFRAVTDRMKAEGWAFDATGPTVLAKRTNPQTGQPEVQDTGYSTGKLNDLDKITLTGDQRARVANINNEGAMARTQAAGSGWAQAPDGSWVRTNPRDASAPPPPPGSTPVTGRRTGTGNPSTLEQRRILNDQLKEHFQLDPNTRKFIAKKGEVYDFRNRPVVQADTWAPGNQEVTQADVEAYDAFRKSIDPTYVPPTTPAPTAAPVTAPDINGPQKATGPDYRLKQNPQNPNQKARSFDGGVTWQISNDGGVTWR